LVSRNRTSAEASRARALPWSSLLTIPRLAGAYAAFLIGSGFATGQEILQFFSGFGLRGLLGCAIYLVIASYLGVSLYLAGHRHRLRNSDEVFRHYAGPVLGAVLGWYAVVVAYSIYVVMLSGAGALLQQHLGIRIELGAAVMAVAVFLTLYFGLHELVDVIGSIGPVLVMLILVIAGAALLGDLGRVRAADTAVESMSILRAAPNWWTSALVYAAMIHAPLAAFLPPLGAATASPRALAWAGIVGPLFFTLALATCALALLGALPEVSGQMIPMLQLATRTTPRLAAIYPWIVTAGIFTTAAPMLWISVVRLARDGSPGYRRLAALLGAVGYFMSMALPFDRLLNLIYPTIGWSGMVLVAFIVAKQIRTRSLG
jgi:uncharacterized membrane protein YkvI